MAALELDDSSSEFEKQFSEKAKELLSRLENNDVAGVVGLIQDLQRVRDESLYQEIGRLTRALHESIKNFKLDSNVQGAGSEIDEANEGLAYVVDMTAKAALPKKIITPPKKPSNPGPFLSLKNVATVH